MKPFVPTFATLCLASTLAFSLGNKGCDSSSGDTDAGVTGGGHSEAGQNGGSSQAGKGGGTSGSTGSGNAGASGGAGSASSASGGGGTGGEGSGALCGTRGSAQCAQGEFCNFEPDAQCGAADGGGHCQTIPQVCYDIYKPVCGCDGKTYANDCEAHGGGTSIAHDGTCDGADGGSGGECMTFNMPRPCAAIYMPVCGCDHKTYASSCVASGFVSSELHDGTCTEDDCAAVGGRAVVGTGPAPMCNENEAEYSSITPASGQVPIEGEICCVPMK